MAKLAVFGGTFDPIHRGHLLVAETALKQSSLDQVLWLPAYQPPHKGEPVAAFHHRMAMVRLAIADRSMFVASDLDVEPSGVSYAARTFQRLQHYYPQVQWFWLIGNDAFQTLPRWYLGETLAEQCTWLVVPRRLNSSSPPMTQWEQCQQVANQLAARSIEIRWQLLDMPPVEISSSLVRQWRREGRSIQELVPDTIRLYIIANNLYK